MRNAQRLPLAVVAACLLAAGLTAAPASARSPGVVVVELHNLSGVSIPRLGELSETTLVSGMMDQPGLWVLDRGITSRALIETGLTVTRIPYDPDLAAELGRAADAQYVLTGAVREFAEGRLKVRFVVFAVDRPGTVLDETVELDGVQPGRAGYRAGLQALMGRVAPTIAEVILEDWEAESGS